MKILVWDYQISGHHPEHIQHLLYYWLEHELDGSLLFVVHPEFPERFPDIAQEAHRSGNVQFITLSGGEYERILAASNRLKHSAAEWEVMSRYAKQYNVDHCIALYLNTLQYAAGRKDAHSAPFTFSGTLFSPGIVVDTTDERLYTRIKAGLTRTRKKLQVRWMLRNPLLKRIFVLNDRRTVETLNDMAGRPVGGYLPDPVPELAANGTAFDLRAAYGFEDRVLFLLFGSLSRRKGVLKTMSALRFLDERQAAKVGLLLLGKSSEELSREVAERKKELQSLHPQLVVAHDSRYVSEDEMRAAFDQSDVVLMPYQATKDASSGIMGHAAHARKPVIGPSHGLLKRLIHEYGLGVTTDVTDAKALAEAIQELMEGQGGKQVDKAGMEQYVRERTPQAFAATILKIRETIGN